MENVTKIEPTGTKDVEITLGKFRLTNALRLSSLSPVGCEFIPTAKELALEAKFTESYCVIAFIEYDEDEGTCDMRTVGPRFHEAINDDNDWHQVKALIETAYRLIPAANLPEEDY